MSDRVSPLLRAAADEIERLERERDELVKLNDKLAAYVAQLEDGAYTEELRKAYRDKLAAHVTALEEGVYTEELRKAYRRGYITGHHAGIAGRIRQTAPERHARGDFGRRFRV